MSAAEGDLDLSGGPARFATTHWSVVLAAGDPEAPGSRAALAALCAAYWYPLYAHVRRQGHPADRAQDLTQEFFARLLEKDFLKGVDRGRGRFRSFLLACLRHFLSNEYDREAAQKRGGGRTLLPIDPEAAEARYRRESAAAGSPEKLFERRWAVALLDQALARLRQEFTEGGRGPLFDALKVFLTGDRPPTTHEQVATRLGMTAEAVKVAAHRLRRRYRELLREEIARTVDDPADVDGEIRDLFAAFG